VSEPATVLGAVGLVAATIYSLWLVQRVFQGRETPAVSMPDLTLREGAMLAAMAAPLLWLGVYPQPIFNAVRPGLAALQQRAVRASAAAPPAATTRPPTVAAAAALRDQTTPTRGVQ
jgi:NADH:ubiquinone oxidoreductase subunit 4 (subunit M)